MQQKGESIEFLIELRRVKTKKLKRKMRLKGCVFFFLLLLTFFFFFCYTVKKE